MKRLIPMLAVALASLGAWVGVLVSVSLEHPSVGAGPPEEPQGRAALVTTTRDEARLRGLMERHSWVGGASDEHMSPVDRPTVDPPLDHVEQELELEQEPGNDDEHEDDDDEDDEVDDDHEDEEASVARSREAAERRVEAITIAADLEAVDLDWAPAMERQIIDGVTDGLAAHVAGGATQISTTCKTTLCITEIEFPPGEGSTRGVNRLARLGLTRGLVVHHEPEAGRGARMVAYLARKGYSLPR